MDETLVGSLIETIYASAFQDDGWDRLLLTLRTQFHASQIAMAMWKWPENSLLFSASTADPSVNEKYQSYYHALDPTPPSFLQKESALRQLRVFPSEAIIDCDAYLKSELFLDFIKPNDMGVPFVSLLDHSGPLFTPMWIHRPVTGRELNRQEQKLLAELTPHLSRGLHMHRELTGLRATADLFESTFDALGAAFLLDARGRVLTMNKNAERLLEGHGVLSIVEGRLGASHPADDTVLAAAFAPSRPGAAPAEIILRGPAHALGLRLAITPVKGGNIPLFGKLAQGEQVAFMVTAAALGPSLQNLMALYGLTRAEAEVALLLSEGLRAPQIAIHRETSIGTVNTQLKQIYAKTGVDGQVALLFKLLGK